MTLNLASTYGDRSFAVSGQVAWNSLPVALWSGDVMAETFRRHLKTILFNCLAFLVAFSALTLLVGRQEGHPACKKLSGGVLVWLSVWSKMQTCIWPSWCHCHSLSLASVKYRLVLPFWYRLTWVVPEKGPLNMCVCLAFLVLAHPGSPV